jgi:hypothetical protein
LVWYERGAGVCRNVVRNYGSIWGICEDSGRKMSRGLESSVHLVFVVLGSCKYKVHASMSGMQGGFNGSGMQGVGLEVD